MGSGKLLALQAEDCMFDSALDSGPLKRCADYLSQESIGLETPQ